MDTARPSSASSEAPSSLEDSTYDLISNRDFSESDAASLTSFEDRQIPDDMSVVEHSDDSDEEEEEGEDANALNTPLDSVMMRGIIGHANFGLRNPLTKVMASSEGTASMSSTARITQRSFESYNFDDATAASPRSRNTTHLSHEIQHATLSDSDAHLTIYQASDVSVQLHFDIVTDKPQARQAYRLLLVGHDHTYDSVIREQIKAALEFNLSANDNADAPRIALDMMTDPPQCLAQGDEVALPIIGLTEPVVMKGANKLFFQGREYAGWDLVVFVHSSLADMAPGDHNRYERMMEVAEEAFRRRHYPAIHISAPLPLYGARPEYFSPEKSGLQLRVVIKPSADSEKIVQDVLPVDIDSFLAIDPEALGCHLDCLDRRPAEQKLSRNSAQYVATVIAEIRTAWRGFSRCFLDFITESKATIREHMNPADVDWINLLLGVVVAVSAICIGILFQRLSVSKPASHVPVLSPVPLTAPNTTSSHPSNWAEALSLKYAAWSEANAMRAAAASWGSRSPSPSGKDVDAAETGLKHDKTAMPDIWMPSLAAPRPVAPKPSSAKAVKPAKSMPFAQVDGFKQIRLDLLRYKVESVGKGHIKITPPPHLPLHGRREVPKFSRVEVFKGIEMRGDAKIDVEIVAMEGGSVTIRIPEGQAQGKVLVAIWNIEHPQGRLEFAAPFPLDFAVPKTGLDNIKDFVMHETVVLQDAMAEVSTRMSTELQHYVSKLEQQGISLQKHAIKRVKDTRSVIGNLSMDAMALSPWFGGCKGSLQGLKHPEKLVKNSVPAIAGRIGVTTREVQHMALQHYQDLTSVLDVVGKWQQSTKWPVRAQDWKPQVALGRGIGNAQGLVRSIRRTPPAGKAPKDPRAGEEDLYRRHWPGIPRSYQRKSKGLILARRGWHVR